MNAHALRSRLRHWWQQEIRPILILAVILFSIRSSLADWNDVPSGSMQPTILVGDRVLVNKVAYDLKVPFTTWHLAAWGNPLRGDIVVFYSPHDGTRLVKRVIGLPGETISSRGDTVLINGAPIQEPWLPPLGPHSTSVGPVDCSQSAFDIPQTKIPANHYFMMGDCRGDSADSRWWGTLPASYVVGKVEVIVWRFGRPYFHGF